MEPLRFGRNRERGETISREPSLSATLAPFTTPSHYERFAYVRLCSGKCAYGKINTDRAAPILSCALWRLPLFSWPVKILEVIQKSSEYAARKGVSSPRLQVELILAHVLKMPRMQLYLSFERELTPEQLDAIRAFVQRRGTREPLQYILGTTSFCGLEIAVNSKVLVPRPETELLAERAWKSLAQLSESSAAPVSALDFGTGSGCLAVALAVHAPKAQVHALDISAEALAVARENAARHHAAIQFHQGDGFSALPPAARFHLIVSNPPYIPTAPKSRRSIRRCAITNRAGALDGGADGLDFYRGSPPKPALSWSPAADHAGIGR